MNTSREKITFSTSKPHVIMVFDRCYLKLYCRKENKNTDWGLNKLTRSDLWSNPLYLAKPAIS